MENRPRSREKYVTGDSKGMNKRSGGSVPIGGASSKTGSSQSGGGMNRGALIGGGVSLPVIIIALVFYLLTGGSGVDPSSMMYDTDSSNWESTSSAKLNTAVAEGSRDKYTTIAGDGSDVVTIMVYMCGTDLESKSSMATNDLNEMAAATLSDKVNLLVYTGGCTQWRNSVVSSSVNQIYKVENGGLRQLVADDGAKSMVAPSTLSSFIKWSAANYPANRYELIMWDHGGGSVSGYGYDEKNKNDGSMTLSGINTALNDGGVRFDFIGFDACLMATAETALMLDEYSDYLIASEETEPGIGWYYTNWLTKLSENTSMSTLEIGKNIIDDFTSTCANSLHGQKTTLSLIDLAEFSNTIPDKLSAFSSDISTTLGEDAGYQTVADARVHTREFAQSSQIDQVDLVNLAENLNSDEGSKLAEALKEAVKYNRTSSNMTNAYGVSIYFPFRRNTYVKKATDTYNDIGLDDSYSKCIKAFVDKQSTGQITQQTPGLGSGNSADIAAIFNLLVSGRDVGDDIEQNEINGESLSWQGDGQMAVISLKEETWETVADLELNMFYDDGEGYINLGLDNVFEFDDDGNLLAATDKTWIAINGQPVTYYHLDTTEEDDRYTITGAVPVLLNGDKAYLILVFDSDNPRGYVAGASYDYGDDVEVVAKNLTEINDGDKIDFMCERYTYDGDFDESFYLGEQLTVDGKLSISNVYVGEGTVLTMYKFTDLYNQSYFTEAIETD